MNIYFAGAIRGGGDPKLYARIINILSEFGNVTTRHLANPEVQEKKLQHLSDEGIYMTDMNELRRSDVIVTEVSGPSLGVGYKIGRAERMGIPVIAIMQEGSGKILSALVAGNPNINLIKYAEIGDLKEKLKTLFSEKLSYLYGPK